MNVIVYHRHKQRKLAVAEKKLRNLKISSQKMIFGDVAICAIKL